MQAQGTARQHQQDATSHTTSQFAACSPIWLKWTVHARQQQPVRTSSAPSIPARQGPTHAPPLITGCSPLLRQSTNESFANAETPQFRSYQPPTTIKRAPFFTPRLEINQPAFTNGETSVRIVSTSALRVIEQTDGIPENYFMVNRYEKQSETGLETSMAQRN